MNITYAFKGRERHDFHELWMVSRLKATASDLNFGFLIQIQLYLFLEFQFRAFARSCGRRQSPHPKILIFPHSNINMNFIEYFQVSMHHSDDITANTEFEYLKNIMFQVRISVQSSFSSFKSACY